jgi:hypothetical protein
MPDWTGIGTGIGQGMQNVAEGLWRREELRRSDREKQAEELHKKGLQIIDNIVQRGYRISHDQDKKPILLDAQGQPAANAPQDVQDLFSQATATSKQLTGLYPAHESGALLQQFRKFLGKPPSPATPDPRAEEYGVERMQGEVPGRKNTFLEDYQDFVKFYQTMKPNAPKEEIDKVFWDDFQAKHSAKDRTPMTLKYYEAPDGSEGDWFVPGDPNIPEGFKARAPGTPPASEAEIAAAGKLWNENAVSPPPKIRGAVETWLVRNNLAPKAGQRVSDFQDFVKLEYGDKPTGDQLLRARELWTGQGLETIQGHVIQVPQPDGSIHSYLVTTTSQKVLPGAGAGGAAIPRGPATSPPQGGGAGGARPGPGSRMTDLGVTGGHLTPAQSKAQTAFAESVKTAAQADKALKTGSSVEGKLLIESLVKAASGRYSQASYNNIVGNTGLANKFQQVLNNIVGGGELPPDVLNQAVKAAHDLRDASKEEMITLGLPDPDLKPAGTGTSDPFLGLFDKPKPK